MRFRPHQLLLSAACLTLTISSVAWAHGGGDHIRGKVIAVSASTISVQTPDGDKMTVTFDSATTFERSGDAASVKDLKAGEKVVIHLRKEDKVLIAEMVMFGKKALTMQGPEPYGHQSTDAGHHD